MREIIAQDASLKIQQILQVVMTLINSLDSQSRALSMGKLFIMDYWTLLKMISLIQLEFFLTLPLSIGTSGHINCLLA